MLAILAYHRVGIGKHSNSYAMLEAHFAYIKKHYPFSLPGEPYKQKKLTLALTFDDATFDFYFYVFPLLKKYDLKALLAIPTHYILENTTCNPEERLQVPYTLAMQEGIYETKAPFCTWKEIEEMSASGHVEMAAHSHLHCNLTFGFVDLEREVIQPKRLLETRLQKEVTSFVYPFGRSSQAVHEYVKRHYKYDFRLGSGYNFSWECTKEPLKRIVCDHLTSAQAPFSIWKRLSYFTKSFLPLVWGYSGLNLRQSTLRRCSLTQAIMPPPYYP